MNEFREGEVGEEREREQDMQLGEQARGRHQFGLRRERPQARGPRRSAIRDAEDAMHDDLVQRDADDGRDEQMDDVVLGLAHRADRRIGEAAVQPHQRPGQDHEAAEQAGPIEEADRQRRSEHTSDQSREVPQQQQDQPPVQQQRGDAEQLATEETAGAGAPGERPINHPYHRNNKEREYAQVRECAPKKTVHGGYLPRFGVTSGTFVCSESLNN